MLELNNALLINQWVKEEITREIRKYYDVNKMKTQHTKIYGIQLTQCWEGNLDK